jgi:hypothetical protein
MYPSSNSVGLKEKADEEVSTFTPNYIAAPEAGKLWDVPKPEDILGIPSSAAFMASKVETAAPVESAARSSEPVTSTAPGKTKDRTAASAKTALNDSLGDSVRIAPVEKMTVNIFINGNLNDKAAQQQASHREQAAATTPPLPLEKVRCLLYLGDKPRKCAGAVFVDPALTWEDVELQIYNEVACEFDFDCERMSVIDDNVRNEELVIPITDNQKSHPIKDHLEACGGSLVLLLS